MFSGLLTIDMLKMAWVTFCRKNRTPFSQSRSLRCDKQIFSDISISCIYHSRDSGSIRRLVLQCEHFSSMDHRHDDDNCLIRY